MQISKTLTSFHVSIGCSRQTLKTNSASQATNYELSSFPPRRDYFHSEVKKVYLETINECTLLNYLFLMIILLVGK